jgi:nucleotidyltransferase/DNA polymerase involved in DNA repair
MVFSAGLSVQEIWGVVQALGEFLRVVGSSVQEIWGVVQALGEFLRVVRSSLSIG